MSTPKTLSPGVRWAPVVGLWAVLLALLTLSFHNFGWVDAWASGVLPACRPACGGVIAFSLLAAIDLSVDTLRRRYPY